MSRESNTTKLVKTTFTIEVSGASNSTLVTVPGGGRLYDIVLRSMEECDIVENQIDRAQHYLRNALGIELHLVDGDEGAIAKDVDRVGGLRAHLATMKTSVEYARANKIRAAQGREAAKAARLAKVVRR